MDDLGKPELPKTLVLISLPFGSIVNSVSIINYQTQDVIGDFLIYPAQIPEKTDDYTTESKFVLPDPSIYNEDGFYPVNACSDPYICNFVGATMGAVEVYPFRYNPVERDLEVFTSLTLRLTYTTPSPPPSAERYMEDISRDFILENVESMVENAEDVVENYEPLNIFSFYESNPNGYSLDAPNPNDTTSKPSDMLFPYTYLIVTNDRYCGYLPTSETNEIPQRCNPLQEWRTELGLPATVRTVQWIVQEYWESPSSYDLQDAIRNFLAEAEEYWGTRWLILVGDVDTSLELPEYDSIISDGYTAIVPARFLCSKDNPILPEDNDRYIPCDLYYMNLSDDFNFDGDEFYGEPYDVDPDYFTYDIDLFGGRVPADTENEVETFISKLLHYEKLDFNLPPNDTYLSKCLQVGADFALPPTDWDIEVLGEDYLSQVFNITNMLEMNRESGEIYRYEKFPDYPEPWEIVKQINTNTPGIINFSLHGHPRGYYILTNGDCSAYIQFLACSHNYLNPYVHGWNFDKTFADVDIDPEYSFHYSDSCSCHMYYKGISGVLGEEFLFNPSWGGPTSIGNVEFGWASNGYDLMEDFYELLLNKTPTYEDDNCYVGDIQCMALQYHWQYENLHQTYVNQLFGCPRTAIWRGDPQTFDAPETDFSNGIITIIVEDNGVPVQEASVCLWMKNDRPQKYFVDDTDTNGEVEFNIGLGGCSNAILTISYYKYNYNPYQNDNFSTD